MFERITMIAEIPKESDLPLKFRATKLLKKWSNILRPEVEPLGTSTRETESNVAPSVNGTYQSNKSTGADESLKDRHEGPVSTLTALRQLKEAAKPLIIDLTEESEYESGTSTTECEELSEAHGLQTNKASTSGPVSTVLHLTWLL